MKYYISFNGVDGSGKTTQIELLQRNNPDIIEVFGGLENYYPFREHATERSFQWWFYNSTPVEFCATMYASIKEREIDIQKSRKPIVLIDKGIDNFDARIVATLKFKGLSKEDAISMIQEYKTKYLIQNNENIKLFLRTADTAEERMRITKARATADMEEDILQPYQYYQQMQNEITEEQLSKHIYNVFDAKGTIQDVNQRLKSQIIQKMMENISIPIDKKIYALGGMSECGKSGAGEYLSRNHNIWNMKLKYFNEQIAQKYGVENIFRNEKEFTSILLSEEIISMLNSHYYKEKITLESLHNFDVTQQLKNIFGDVLQIVYIDTNYKNRVVRTAIGEKIEIEEAKKQVDRKDRKKSEVGADKIKTIADEVINNNSSQMKFKEQLDLIAIDKKKYRGKLKGINDFDIPKEYQETLETFYNTTKSELGEGVRLFLVTGSCARSCVSRGWSDIDIIMVVEENNHVTRSKIHKTTSSSKIKIGTTIYSISEFQEKKIDLKTAYALHEMEEGRLKPTICDKDLKVPVVTDEDVKEMCNNIIPSSLHTLRRLLYTSKDIKQNNEDVVFKKLSHLMRDYLLQENINATNYQDVYDKFAENFKFEKFDTRAFIQGEEGMSVVEYCNNIIDTLTHNKENKKEEPEISKEEIENEQKSCKSNNNER